MTFATEKKWADAYAYAWSGEGIDVVVFSEAWPGTKMEAAGGVFTYKFQAENEPEYILFDDGTKEGGMVGTNQTENLAFENGKGKEKKKSFIRQKKCIFASARASATYISLRLLV